MVSLNSLSIRRFLPILALTITTLLLATPTSASVRIIRGPTPIDGGSARAAGDLTVMNEHLAFALAIDSPPPYGVPRGALIDLAPVAGGVVGRDKVVFADFIPNNWSAWPNSFHRVEIVRETSEEAVIKVERDWGAVLISTLYSLKAGEDRINIVVTMTNGGTAPLTALRSGLTLWPSAGHLFSVPGLAGLEDGPAAGALADRVVAYDEDWVVALHAPDFDHVGYGSKDMLTTHDLAPGQSRSFEGWLQVETGGSLAPVMAAEIARRKLPAGELSGTVTAVDGVVLPNAVVIAEKDGKTYGWTVGGRDGRYRLPLPAGDYTVYAAAKGFSETGRVSLSIASGAARPQDFSGLQPPGTIHFEVTRKDSGAPLEGRIAIESGAAPVVEFLGRKVFFTELDRRGVADVSLAPGDYVLSVSWGKDFVAPAAEVRTQVISGQTRRLAVPIEVAFDPGAKGWFAADLHHHADQAEAITPPADLARSQLAAGLDLLFVSDHDSTVNHRALQAIADRRGIPFLPSVEISTSWAHFNVYPIRLGEPLAIDTGNTDIGAVLDEARRLGAEVVQVNHPFIPYGYLASVAGGVAPGGFNPGFDLLEINSDIPQDDDKVLAAAWDFWNAGHRYYLSAGTDTHDVWNHLSGKVRIYAHPDGPLSASSFARALKAGHAYVTYGPLIFPDRMFGEEIRLKRGQAFDLGFALQSVQGLKSATLISRGAAVKVLDLSAQGQQARIDFALTAAGPAWYALIVEDQDGRSAYTDPVWVEEAIAP